MRLDYMTQLSPEPISLSIGVLRKPTLREFSKLTFDKLNYYEYILRLSPEEYYTELKGDEGKEYWKSLSDESRNDINIYKIVESDEGIKQTFVEIFNFFFVETVVYKDGFFLLLKEKVATLDEVKPEQVCGVIAKENFLQAVNLIQQILCINDSEESMDEMKFKNDIAKKLYSKMHKATAKKSKSVDMNLTIPNIISSISNKHPSLNYLNIWDLTMFQLLDSFNRMQSNSMYDLSCTRVAVWGDKDKAFDPSLWYKNNFDSK